MPPKRLFEEEDNYSSDFSELSSETLRFLDGVDGNPLKITPRDRKPFAWTDQGLTKSERRESPRLKGLKGVTPQGMPSAALADPGTPVLPRPVPAKGKKAASRGKNMANLQPKPTKEKPLPRLKIVLGKVGEKGKRKRPDENEVLYMPPQPQTPKVSIQDSLKIAHVENLNADLVEKLHLMVHMGNAVSAKLNLLDKIAQSSASSVVHVQAGLAFSGANKQLGVLKDGCSHLLTQYITRSTQSFNQAKGEPAKRSKRNI